MTTPLSRNGGPRYAAYDTKTGRILHAHSRFSIAENRFVEIPIEELKARFSKDETILARLSEKDAKNLDFVPVEPSDRIRGPMMVDPATRKLVPRPRLRLKATKNELAGDGQDATKLEISTIDSDGRHLSHATKVKVATTRGKLSARGGIVELKGGHASLTLTSANETAGTVHLSVIPLDSAHVGAKLDVEFV